MAYVLRRWYVFVLGIIGILTYINVLPNGFVWDDFVYIVNNADVHRLNLSSVFEPSTFNHGLTYRPLQQLAYSLAYFQFGNAAFWYHLVQVWLHVSNTVLVYLLFSRFFIAQIAVFLAAIFLIHPMQVESVAYIAGMLDPLYVLFGLSALLIITGDTHKGTAHVLASVCFLFSLFIKETGILFVPIFFAYALIFGLPRKTLIIQGVVFVLTMLVYGYLRFFVGKVGLVISRSGVVPIAALDVWGRLLNIPAIAWYYLKTFLFPLTLAIDQQWIVKTVTPGGFWMPLFGVVAFVMLCVWYARYLFHQHRKMYGVFLLFSIWFGVSWIFHFQVFPLDMTVSDRFFYMPMIGLLGMIGVGIQGLLPVMKRYKMIPAGIVLAVGICVLLFVRTVVRNGNWSDERTLYEHDREVYDSFNVENNLGNVYVANGKYRDALYRFRQSRALFPTELNTFNVGYAYDLLDEPSDAIRFYEESLTYAAYPPDERKLITALTVENLSKRYLLVEHYQRARDLLDTHVQDYPDNGRLWQYLAISEYNLGNKEAALAALDQANKYRIVGNSGSETLYALMMQDKPVKLIQAK